MVADNAQQFLITTNGPMCAALLSFPPTHSQSHAAHLADTEHWKVLPLLLHRSRLGKVADFVRLALQVIGETRVLTKVNIALLGHRLRCAGHPRALSHVQG